MKRRKHPNECPECKGIGTTPETATEVVQDGKRLKTVARGSGCPRCHGIGRIEQRGRIQ